MYKFLFALLMKNDISKFRRSHSPSTVTVLKDCWTNIKTIKMNGTHPEENDDVFSHLTKTNSWHQITSLFIDDPLDLYQLRLVLSQMINLRTLQLCYTFDYDSDNDLNNQKIINLLSDTSLCRMLMSNGLQKLIFYADCEDQNMINIASLIVKQLPHLQIIELMADTHDQLPEILYILISGLSKLNFIIIHGGYKSLGVLHPEIHDLRKKITRPYRIDYHDSVIEASMLYVWL